MAEEAELYYFDGRGRAELIRMSLCAANIKYRGVNLEGRDQFLKLIQDGDLAFNAVPLLKIDDMKLVQTNAILRYVASRAGMAGKDDKERAMVDMYFEGSRDLIMPFLGMILRGTEEETKATAEPVMNKFLPIFEKVLGSSISGYLVGSGLTLADLGLIESLLAITDYFGVSKLDAYPNLKLFYDKILGLERMQYYMKNIRKRKNDERYASTVKRVLGRS